MKLTRHKMREVAFQTLFALASEPDADRETIYRSLIKLNDDEQAPAFLDSLVSGVIDHQEELDQQISAHLAGGGPFSDWLSRI